MKVAIVGSHKLTITNRLKEVIEKEIARLVEDGADTFYFCDTKDSFCSLCYDVVTKYNVKRLLARSYFVMRDEDTADYKVEFTENKFFAENLKEELQIYITADRDIIGLCDVLFTCCSVKYNPLPIRKKRADALFVIWDAKLKRKKVINVYEML